jgi:nitrite reductase/ring-hydroxylating ferredoxin subunit
VEEFDRIGTMSELEPYGQFSKWLQNHDVLVYRLDSEIKAMSNICPHFGAPVGFHKLRDGKFTCLWHTFNSQRRVAVCVP